MTEKEMHQISLPNKRLIDLIRENFYERLEHKTGWGRTQLRIEFEAAIADALAQFLDEQVK